MSATYYNRVTKKQRKYALIRTVKESTPCADCGKYYPYWAMDFDHVRGSKSGPMTEFVGGHSIGKLLAEIAKCDVVCAICHRHRTHKRSYPEEFNKWVSTPRHTSRTRKSFTGRSKNK